MILTIVLIGWLIIVQIKIQDNNRQIDELKNRLNITNKKLSKLLSGKEEIIREEKTIEADICDSFEEENHEFIDVNEQNEENETENSLENFFLGNAFTIIGALALIIGAGIFIKLISPFFIFTPLMKTITGYIFGIALIGTSIALKNPKLKTYSEVLTGTGFSILFITTLCTTVLFKTFSPAVCTAIAGIILTASYIAAEKQKTISMIIIALIGGYLNFAFASHIDINMAFGYMIFLNLLTLIYSYRNPKTEWINIANLVITLLLISILMLVNGQINNINIAYPIILWLIYLAYDAININKDGNNNKLNILNQANLIVLTLFSLIIFDKERLYIGIVLICAAIIYNLVAGYLMMKGSEKFKSYIYSMLITILLSVYFLTEDVTRIAVWSVIGLIIAFISGKLKKDYLANWSIVFFIPAMTNLFFINEITDLLTNYTPVFNSRLSAFAFPLISTAGAYLLINNSDNKNTLKTAQIIKFIFLSLIYLYTIFEINNYINENSVLKYPMNIMPSVIIGFIYTIQMRKIAETGNMPVFKTVSYITGITSLMTLLIFGINYIPAKSFIPVLNIRFAAYITAIGTSIYFAKKTKLEVYKYLAIILGFILVSLESFNYTNKIYTSDISYIVSIVWLLYSGIITTLGILKDKSYLKNSGIIISILTLCRIFFCDLKNVDAIYKLILFIALGIIFMLISYLYNKRQK